MTGPIPTPVARYLAAEDDLDALTSAFLADAVVLDEGHTHIGREAIAAWWSAATAAFEFTATTTTSEPFGPEAYLVVQHLEGDFPGGVVDLEFRFALSGEHIAALMIYPVGP